MFLDPSESKTGLAGDPRFVSIVALTDFHQAGKMEFHPSFDFACRNVVTTRFQTLRQPFRTAEHAHRLAADI